MELLFNSIIQILLSFVSNKQTKFDSLFTIVSLPPGGSSKLDEHTKKTTISFPKGKTIVLDKRLNLEEVHGIGDLTDNLQGRRVDGYFSDGGTFVAIKEPSDLQLPEFQTALASGCRIRLRKL